MCKNLSKLLESCFSSNAGIAVTYIKKFIASWRTYSRVQFRRGIRRGIYLEVCSPGCQWIQLLLPNVHAKQTETICSITFDGPTWRFFEYDTYEKEAHIQILWVTALKIPSVADSYRLFYTQTYSKARCTQSMVQGLERILTPLDVCRIFRMALEDISLCSRK